MQADTKSAAKSQPPRRNPFWRWLRIPVYTLLTLFMLTGGAITYLLVDQARIKNLLEDVVSATTARPLHIRGEFEIELGRTLTIRATDIEWSNPPWSNSAHMLAVDKAEISVDLKSLWSPPYIINNVALSNAQLEFEWTKAGQFNWQLGDTASTEDDSNNERHPFPLLLDKASLDNVLILFRHPDLTEPLPIKIVTARQQQDEKNNLVIQADTEVDERKIGLRGKIGPFPNLIVAGAIDFEAHLKGPNATLDLKGDIEDLMNIAGVDFDLTWEAPEIAVVLDILNLPPVTSGSSQLKAHLLSDGQDIDGSIKGHIGEFLIDSSFQAKERDTLEGLHVRLKSTGPTARTAGRVLGVKGMPDSPYEVRLKADMTEVGLAVSDLYAQTAETNLTGSALLRNAPSIADADLSINLYGNNLALFQGLTEAVTFPAYPFSAEAKITSNGLGKPNSFTGQTTLGKIRTEVTATLSKNTDLSGSTINYVLTFPKLKSLADFLGIELLKPGSLNIRGQAQVEASGIAIKDVAVQLGINTATVNGYVPLTATAKEPDRLRLEAVLNGSNLADLIGYFAPTDGIPELAYAISSNIHLNDGLIDFQQVDGSFGTTQFTASGQIKPGNKLPDISLSLSSKGPDLDELLQGFVNSNQLQDDFKLDARLNISGSGIAISDLDFRLGQGYLKGDINSGWPENPEQISFNLSAKGENLRNSVPDISRYHPAPVTFHIQARGKADRQHIQIDNATAQLGSSKAMMDGLIYLEPQLSAKNFTLNIQGKHLSDLGSIQGWDVTNAPFKFAATMSGSENKLTVNNLDLEIDSSNLRGSVLIDTTQKPKLNLTLSSTNFELGTFLSKNQEEALELSESAADTPSDGRLIPDMDLPFETLKKFNANVAIKLDRVSRLENVLTDVAIDAQLKEGALELQKFHAVSEDGYVDASLGILPRKGAHDLKLRLTGRNMELALVNLSVSERESYKGHNVDLQFTSHGSNLRELASELDGYIWVRGGKRKLENLKFMQLFGDFLSELITLVNPFAQKEPYTQIDCDRIFFEVNNGIMQTSPTILFRTDKLNIMAVGKVDLGTEKIKFGIETTPRTGIGISASDLVNPFINIGGTIAKPKIALNPKGTLIEGGAAVMTLGVSILAKSLYKRWLGPSQPCSSYTQRAREIRTEIDPENVPLD
jgi:uncharacterized protein involved in outer membrane biogenesis